MSDLEYKFAEGLPATVKKFRQRGTGGDTMIFKIDHDKEEIQEDTTMKGISLKELGDHLDEASEPRYVLHIHTQKHADGRVQYPLALIMHMPESTPSRLKTLYTRPLPNLVSTFGVNKHIVLEDCDDLTEDGDDWLNAKLKV